MGLPISESNGLIQEVEESKERSPEQEKEKSESQRPFRVLIANDEQMQLYMLQVIFQMINFEVVIAQAVALASPGERTAADLVAAIPVEAFDLGVGRVLVRGPPVQVLFVKGIVAFQNRVRFFHRCRALAAMWVFPWALTGVDVVFYAEIYFFLFSQFYYLFVPSMIVVKLFSHVLSHFIYFMNLLCF